MLTAVSIEAVWKASKGQSCGRFLRMEGSEVWSWTDVVASLLGLAVRSLVQIWWRLPGGGLAAYS